MRINKCFCGARLFYENTNCLTCHRELGWCPFCQAISALEPLGSNQFKCLGHDCGQTLVKCRNYAEYEVCNRMVSLASYENGQPYCDCCQCNRIIPDLSIPGAQARWAALEKAKRRLFYTLDLLHLPHPAHSDSTAELPLSFSFMSDAIPEEYGKWTLVNQNVVYTGHLQGNITINVREADDAERERMRLNMGEKHRTLVGHFRHEIGHYYWEILIRGKDEANCISIFGNHDSPTYSEALNDYYAHGPSSDWEEHYISSYASMHPWEDFAETFAFYLDIISVMDTAKNLGFIHDDDDIESHRNPDYLPRILNQWSQLSVILNEFNRDMGLLDFAPEIIRPTVQKKLEYIHQRITSQGHTQAAACP